MIQDVTMEALEKRMYFFTIYQLTGIQKGIQCGHCVEQYASNYHDDPVYADFVKNWRTWIVLNGGTTNSNLKTLGSLNNILIELRENEIKHAYFHEPDLNNALTAVCVLLDERVFNFKKFPDWKEGSILENNLGMFALVSMGTNYDGQTYGEWLEYMGGSDNLILRELIRDKNLA